MPRMILSTGLACELKGRFNLQAMTKSTLKPLWTTAWDGYLAGILEKRFWKLSLRVLPWIGFLWLLWQIHDRWAALSDSSWDSALWGGDADLTGAFVPWDGELWGSMLLRWGILCLVFPLVSLWVDSIRWVLLMYPSLSDGAALKLAWRQLPIVAYSMLGSVVIPGRLSEFAGRCRFYPTEQHPKVMASTLMASLMQWIWVLAFPGLWILGNAALNQQMTSDLLSGEGMKGMPALLGSTLSDPLVGLVLAVFAAGIAVLWSRIFEKLQRYEWKVKVLVRVNRWSLLRYGLLVMQWALWLRFALITMDSWTLAGGIFGMLALQWFMPLGFLLDLGVKGALSLWVWGNVMMYPEDALLIPLLIWTTNLVFPALLGGLWWVFKGRQIQTL